MTDAAHSGGIVAYCDGGSRGNPGPSGYGVSIEDAAGHPVADLSEFLGVKTNNFAEYSGLLAALEYALAHGYPRLRVIAEQGGRVLASVQYAEIVHVQHDERAERLYRSRHLDRFPCADIEIWQRVRHGWPGN